MSKLFPRILSIASEHLFLLDHIEARYLNLCEEYHFFLIKHAEQLESTEVRNFFFFSSYGYLTEHFFSRLIIFSTECGTLLWKWRPTKAGKLLKGILMT